MFIEYCVISKILKYIPDSGLSRFPLGFSVCTQWQVKHQRCSSRTCRVQKNHNILRKNTLFIEHPFEFLNTFLGEKICQGNYNATSRLSLSNNMMLRKITI